MSNLINYLTDNQGEIHSMKIKEFYQNDQQRMEYEDQLTQAFCKCGVELDYDEGSLCLSCDDDEADYLIHSFHDAWDYIPPGHKRVDIPKKRGYFDLNTLERVEY